MTAPASEERTAADADATARNERYGNSLLRGSIWMIAVRWAMRLVGLVSTMILARLLAPADFGLIAMAMLTYGLLETISYAGVDQPFILRTTANITSMFDSPAA